MFQTSQPELVCAILGELDRQNPGRFCSTELFDLICRAADQITQMARESAPDTTDEAA